MKSERGSDEIAAAMVDFIQSKTQFSTSSVKDGLNHKVTSSRRAYRAARFLCYNVINIQNALTDKFEKCVKK